MIKRPEYFANRPAPAGSNRITPINLEVLQGILHRPGRIDLGGVVKDNIHPVSRRQREGHHSHQFHDWDSTFERERQLHRLMTDPPVPF